MIILDPGLAVGISYQLIFLSLALHHFKFSKLISVPIALSINLTFLFVDYEHRTWIFYFFWFYSCKILDVIFDKFFDDKSYFFKYSHCWAMNGMRQAVYNKNIKPDYKKFIILILYLSAIYIIAPAKSKFGLKE